VYGRQDFVQTEAVTHCRDELDQQIAGVVPDDGGAEDLVSAWRGQHLDEAVCFLVRDCAIEVFDAVRRYSYAIFLFLRLLLVDADTRYFGLGKRCTTE
jgi:hypothetical protein